MNQHFQKIYRQREIVLEQLEHFAGMEWERPQQDKWSWGETYYHLYLMMKFFRRLSKVYVSIAKPFALLSKNKPFLTSHRNIYVLYQENNKKVMRAPIILVPPEREKIKFEFEELLVELDKETKRLESLVEGINDNIAGHIRFFDPLANHPNLIQSIDLLGIHEQHHFSLCQKYYK